MPSDMQVVQEEFLLASNPLQVNDLPPPPPGRTGFPWTEGTPSLPATLPHGKPYPKISIVTPSYQQGEFLEETIRSVLLQGYPNLEYMVIDGGSRDNSVEILRKYAPFLTFWVSERDAGQANAVNKGFARATGDIMGWLNSDDILLPRALYWIARTLSENPQVDLVTGFRKNLDKTSRITSNWIRDVPNDYYLRHYCCIAQEATYWRRSMWEKLGPIDESFQFALDYEYWLRAIHSGSSLQLIPQYIGGFRDYAENKSNSWQDVYYHDMNLLYQRYQMGKDEADVHAQLGGQWAMRYPLYLKISEQSWTNSPRLVQLAWRILENPLLCDLVLGMWRFYDIYNELRQDRHQFHLQALRSTISRVLHKFRQTNFDRSYPPGSTWGDVRTIPAQEQSDPDEALSFLTTDTLAFGDGWYPVEYWGEYFRWSSGNGDFYVLNASGKPLALRLLVAPAIPSSKNRLDLLDENENLLTSVIGNTKRLEVDISLPATVGERVRYQLRWHGLTAGETNRDKRRLAFRILRLGQQPEEAAEKRPEKTQDVRY